MGFALIRLHQQRTLVSNWHLADIGFDAKHVCNKLKGEND